MPRLSSISPYTPGESTIAPKPMAEVVREPRARVGICVITMPPSSADRSVAIQELL
jgi:hypothetical protein